MRVLPWRHKSKAACGGNTPCSHEHTALLHVKKLTASDHPSNIQIHSGGEFVILIPAFTGNTHTHPQPAVTPTAAPLVWWRCFGMRFIATLDCCWHGKSPANETERRGGRTIVVFPPVFFLNLNNICTLGEGCEIGVDLGSRAEPKKSQGKSTRSLRTEPSFGSWEGPHHRLQKHIFQFHKPQPPWWKLVAKCSAC